MATNTSNFLDVSARKKTKIETRYEYVPIIGEILGYWRKASAHRFGVEIELRITTPLQEYDRLIVNGEEVPIPNKNQ